MPHGKRRPFMPPRTTESRGVEKFLRQKTSRRYGVTPFFKMMLPYLAVSPVITTAKAFLARS